MDVEFELLIVDSAKYIEGLENRLGRMEHLLRLSGVLDEDDNTTDLGALEKKLTEKHSKSRQASMVTTSSPTSPSQAPSGPDGSMSTPQSSLTSPHPIKDEQRKSVTPMDENGEEQEEVEALSEMMCSLVTNGYGETRYIGEYNLCVYCI